jgi:hypothetical protein
MGTQQSADLAILPLVTVGDALEQKVQRRVHTFHCRCWHIAPANRHCQRHKMWDRRVVFLHSTCFNLLLARVRGAHKTSQIAARISQAQITVHHRAHGTQLGVQQKSAKHRTQRITGHAAQNTAQSAARISYAQNPAHHEARGTEHITEYSTNQQGIEHSTSQDTSYSRTRDVRPLPAVRRSLSAG